MSPTAALSSSDYASALYFTQQHQQQQPIFTLQEVGVTRSLDPTPAAAPLIFSQQPLANGRPSVNGGTSVGAHLYPTTSDVAAVDTSAMPAGPSLEHSSSRRDRL